MKQAPLKAIAAFLLIAGCSGEPAATPPDDSARQAEADTPGDVDRSTVAPSPDDQTSGSASSSTVPTRFHGLYAPDLRACAEDYTYNPAFQNVTVGAREVRFFETGGPVTNVNVDGNSIAITLRETVGDGEFTRAIYLALNDDQTARYRAETGASVETYVRCPSE